MQMKIRNVAAVVLLLVVSLWACQKEISDTGNTPTQQVSLYLTDDPAVFDSVLIDIQAVHIE